jgi:dolichyl-phosphate-mannose-protein mannosyltransferase/tetratricopeptide repeat protein
MSLFSWSSPKHATCVAALLLACLALELTFASRQQAQTFDEADHILAGYRYWKCSDFAANPEHPPMVKLLASFPLLFQRWTTPSPLCGYSDPSTHKDFIDGRTFLYSNNADSILSQTRLFAGLFTLGLGMLLFESANRMFGAGTALLALTIFVFEPNLLAHGFLVTTDMGLACSFYAAIYAFYLYLQNENRRWVGLSGILAGTTLAAKHSGILIFPLLLTLAITDLAVRKIRPPADERRSTGRQVLRMARALAFVALIAYVVLWAFYGFRFAARPNAEAMTVPAISSASGITRKVLAAIFTALLRIHFLPESYLFGLKHVLLVVHGGGPILVLGRIYPTGRWFYFPVVFLVKSTLGFLVLLLLATVALWGARDKNWRALSILTISPLLFLAFCLPSKLNIGIRHILPVYPFLIVFAAAGAWELRKYRSARYVVALLITLHASSSLASFPNYIPYSNEAFGGTRNTYRVLGESNVDWGQSLKAIMGYVRKNGIQDCWVSYLTSADPAYYPTGCRLLPTAYGWVSRDDMDTPLVDGTVLIGTSELEGTEGSNPYSQFRNMVPADSFAGTVLVFHGRFDLPLVFAMAQINRAATLSEEGRFDEAVEKARAAAAVAPDVYSVHAQLARTLAAANRIAEARTEYQSAISLARAIHGEYNERDLAQFEKELRQLP